MFKQFGAPELLIIAALILLLFGAKRLPDAARGLGRSLRIFKAETKGLTDSDTKADAVPAAPEQLPAADAAPATPPADSVPSERTES